MSLTQMMRFLKEIITYEMLHLLKDTHSLSCLPHKLLAIHSEWLGEQQIRNDNQSEIG